MNCSDCGKPMSTAEAAAYRNRCEDCWTGGRFVRRAAAEYTGVHFTKEDLEQACCHVEYLPDRKARRLKHER